MLVPIQIYYLERRIDLVPVVRRRKNETKTEWIKRYTNILYDLLPQTSLEDRAKFLDIRDKIIELNYSFFGYVVSQKFLNNSYITYEDKLQACISRFCECWTWYKFEAKYRTDISFSVFYKPRLGEMLERDFNEVQYSLRRTLMMEVGDQLGKHWTKVTYEDLADPRLHISADHMTSLMAIFGSLYPASQEDISPYLEAPDDITKDHGIIAELTDEYDDIVSLLVREMIEKEKKLSTKDINKLAEILDLDAKELKAKVPLAEAQLYQLLKKDINS